jgi:ribosomal protein S18
MKKVLLLLFLISVKSFAQNFDYKNYNAFLQKYVSERGNVNYDKIKANKAELDGIVAQFEKNQPTDKWTKNEKMAYFINCYNVYTLSAVVAKYPVKSIKDISNVWDKKFIPQGKVLYSLGDIEHKILRKMGDPRIHFAINCASFSCPNLSNDAFLPEKLDSQLEIAAKSFINDKSKNVITTTELKLSSIFDWFGGDFKAKGSIIDYLNKYSTIKIEAKAKTKFLDYNWSLNK